MAKDENFYEVGATVYVETFGGGHLQKTTVKEVKSLKRGLKVTTSDGIEWDVDHDGRMWGSRGIAYYTGSKLKPNTPEMELSYRKSQVSRQLRSLGDFLNRMDARKLKDLDDDQLADLQAANHTLTAQVRKLSRE